MRLEDSLIPNASDRRPSSESNKEKLNNLMSEENQATRITFALRHKTMLGKCCVNELSSKKKTVLKRGLHQIILQFIFLTESFCRFMSSHLPPMPPLSLSLFLSFPSLAQSLSAEDQIHLTDDGQLRQTDKLESK